ncbi:MAG TPA: histidine phosphatase family protein [Candidatus Binataceae bacterium]|nr:histidine phosphatase family protein [Candidatus Binataceae bacterium]
MERSDKGSAAPPDVARKSAGATTLIVVRHGETVGNSSIRYYGRTDLELSDLGLRQMAAAREWLMRHFANAALAPVFASPLRRASAGARIIAGPAASIVELEEFVEVNFGRFEGLTADEIGARYPEDFARWTRDRLDPRFTYPGGERRADFVLRVARGVKVMLEVMAARAAEPAAGVALLVAHRGVIRVVTRELAGVEPVIELGSIQLLCREAPGAQWRAERRDVIDHLAGVV